MALSSGFMDTKVEFLESCAKYVDGLKLPQAANSPVHHRTIAINENEIVLDGNYFASLEQNAQAGTKARQILDALTYAVIEHHKKVPLVHAAMVRCGDKTILIPGISESGKSTLCYLLQYFGATLFTDELVAIDEQNLNGFSRPLHVRHASISALTDEGINVETISQTNDGAYVRTTDFQHEAPISPLMVIIPDWNQQNKCTKFKPLSAADICQKLMQTCVNARNFDDHGLQRIAKLARSAKGFRFSYSTSNQMPQLLNEL